MLVVEVIYIIYSVVIFATGCIMYLEWSRDPEHVSCNPTIYVYMLINSLIKLIGLGLFINKKYNKIREHYRNRQFTNIDNITNDMINNQMDDSFINPYTVNESINININDNRSDSV